VHAHQHQGLSTQSHAKGLEIADQRVLTGTLTAP
jgi:hypothetical protein